MSAHISKTKNGYEIVNNGRHLGTHYRTKADAQKALIIARKWRNDAAREAKKTPKGSLRRIFLNR